MITSVSNQQIRHLLQLQKKARARKEEGVFIVEGIKMYQEAPREWIVKTYVSESFLKKTEYQHVLGQPDAEILSDEVFRKVSDTQTPQGILCVVRMPENSLESMLTQEAPLFLLAENIQDPGNLGTIVRTGEGAGVSGVIMSRDTVDIFNPKTIRSTMGSIYRVPFLYAEDFQDVIRRIQSRGISVYAAHLKGTASYDDKDYTGGTAFLIGNEGNGLTEETAALATDYIRIPMNGEVESLNAAVASALLLYEAARQRRKRDNA